MPPTLLHACGKCGTRKNKNGYTPSQWSKAERGWKRTCKRCERDARYFRNYGRTYDELFQMYQYQWGECPICDKPLLFGRTTRVDHDHDTGAVRGILCNECNLALGHLKDVASAGVWAAFYLIRTADRQSEKFNVICDKQELQIAIRELQELLDGIEDVDNDE